MSPYVKAAGGGVVGGIIGALIWAGIGYAFHREIGWIAWGIGGLVGLGVRFAAQENDGYQFGVIAVVVVILSIVAGKYLAISFIASKVQSELNKVTVTITDDDMVETKADEVAAEWRAKGKQTTVTAGLNDIANKNYTPEVQNEAKRRWQAVPAADRKRLMAAEKARIDAAMKNIGKEIRRSGFADSFSAWDILWVILAAVTAFKLGAGMFSQE